MNGIIIVNKDKDYTSRDVVNVLNKVLKTKKIGHTGTLDPIATGVLVVCVGKYTKLVSEITSYDKEYIAEMKLGIQTTTGDITGDVVCQKDYNVDSTKVKEVLSSCIGKYIQTVPIYSAIKVNGKKLYEYARNNESVVLPKREVDIKQIELLEYNEDTIKFRCLVSKGTYIRSLIEDISKKLNTVGTMTELKRTKQGKFSIDKSYTLEDIKNGNYEMINIEDLLSYQVIEIDYDTYIRVSNGAKISLNSIEEKVLLKYEDNIIAIYMKDNELYKPYVMLLNQ